MRSGSYTKDAKLASCIPRPSVPIDALCIPAPIGMPLATAAGMNMNMHAAAATPVRQPAAPQRPSYFPTHYEAGVSVGMDMDAHAHAQAASAVSESEEEERDSDCSNSTGSESDAAEVALATELLAPDELTRGCTFDEACRMLLDVVDGAVDDEAGEGLCTLDW